MYEYSFVAASNSSHTPLSWMAILQHRDGV